MNYDKVIFLDLETSGFDPEQHEIIQVSAVDTYNGERFNEYVRFHVNWANSRALEVNHYDEKVWEQKAVSQKQAFYNLKEWLSRRKYYNRKTKNGDTFEVALIAGHNLQAFDSLFVREWECMFCDELGIDYAYYDTLQLARWVLPGLESHSLESLCKYYGIETKALHNSLQDVLANIKIAYKLLQRIGMPPPWHKDLL